MAATSRCELAIRPCKKRNGSMKIAEIVAVYDATPDSSR
jgi:hypothetical protein